jgi:hypothetical protein
VSLTSYYANAGLNYLLCNTSGASATVVYLALFTGDPTITPSLEVTAGEYARQPVTFQAPLNGETRNGTTLTFDTPVSGWGTLSYYALFDAATSGNMLFYEAFEETVNAASGVPITVAAGTLIVSLE